METIMDTDAKSLISSDPVTFEVVRSGLYAICEEMKVAVMRTSFSPLLSLSADLSCAILDDRGAVAAQGNDIPVHLGAMPFTGRAVLDAFPASAWREGDGVLLNDPYLGGTHLPDVSLLMPAFVGGALIGFAATRVHWPDVGGIAAGSSSIADEIFKEGIRILPIRILDRGAVREDVLNLILANVRVPEDRRGDFQAQLAGNRRGVARLRELGERYGTDVVGQVLSDSQRYSRLQMQHRLAALPDCEVRHAESLDGDGFVTDGRGSLTIRVGITKRGERVRVDFTGTSPAARGPVNAPLPVTASSVYYTLIGLAGGDIQPNSGAYSVAEIVAPAGSLVHAAYPAAVVAANTETSNRIVDVLLGALAKAYPDRVPAGSYGSACVVSFGGHDLARGRNFVHYETVGGGMGARSGQAGVSGLRVHMGNTMNLPIEALEAALPVRFHAYEILRETAGEGAWPGGAGVRRMIEMLANGVQASVLGERTATPAAGIAGGGEGGLAAFLLHPQGGAPRVLASKSGPHLLNRGDMLEIRTAGGGGWGRPGPNGGPVG
jgi:N-methylhydantoinase B